MISAELLAAVIAEHGVKELARWLSSRGGDPITDAEILVKLRVDADKGIAIGRAWLDEHPRERVGRPEPDTRTRSGGA
jgi:hypothetical protein